MQWVIGKSPFPQKLEQKQVQLSTSGDNRLAGNSKPRGPGVVEEFENEIVEPHGNQDTGSKKSHSYWKGSRRRTERDERGAGLPVEGKELVPIVVGGATVHGSGCRIVSGSKEPS